MSDFTWNGTQAEEIALKAAEMAGRTMAEKVLVESKNEVPHDTGTLSRSGTVTKGENRTTFYVSYNTPYARRQHEELGYAHGSGRKAKYLEDPFTRLAPKIEEFISLAVKKALKNTR